MGRGGYLKNSQKFPWEKTFEELGILNALMPHYNSSNELISELLIPYCNSGEAKCSIVRRGL